MICDCCKHSKNCCKIISENTFCSSYEHNNVTIVFANGNTLSLGDTLYYINWTARRISKYYVFDIIKSSRKIVVAPYNVLTTRVMSFDDINHSLFLTRQEAKTELRRLVYEM